VTPLNGTTSWFSDGGRFRARLRVMAGTAVIRFDGRLDAGAVRAGRASMEAALGLRIEEVTLDLEAADVTKRSVVVLAALLRTANRHGVVPEVAGLPVALRAPLAALAPRRGYRLS
jgi:hypothetical protein